MIPAAQEKILNLKLLNITNCNKIHLSDDNTLSLLKTLHDNNCLEELYISMSLIKITLSESGQIKTIIKYMEKKILNCKIYDENEKILNSFKFNLTKEPKFK